MGMNQNTTLYTKRFDSAAPADVTEDFSLPDYQPEIRRIIGVRAQSSVDGKYLSGEELETDGAVTYTVLYSDPDGGIAQTSQTSSFTCRLPLKGNAGEHEESYDRYTAADLVLSCTPENVTCRVTAPRKFTLSSRVKLGLLSQKPADVSLKTPEGMIPRRRTETHRTAAMTEIRKTAEAEGEIREREGVKILFAQGNVCLTDVRPLPGNAREIPVKGDAYLTVLLLTPDGTYAAARGRAPVEESIPLPENLPACGELRAAVFPSVILTELETDGDGGIRWRMEYDLDCEVLRCGEAEVTADAYLPTCEEQLAMAEVSSFGPAAAVNGRLTVSASVKLPPERSYVCAWGSGTAEKCAVRGGRLYLDGAVKLCVVTAGGGDAAAEEVTVPLRYECEAADGAWDAEDGEIARKVQVTVTEVNARAERGSDGDLLSLSAELAIAAAALESETVHAAVSIAPIAGAEPAENGRRKSGIRVYVPDAGESAWDVEKRFRLGREAKPEGHVYVI